MSKERSLRETTMLRGGEGMDRRPAATGVFAVLVRAHRTVKPRPLAVVTSYVTAVPHAALRFASTILPMDFDPIAGSRRGSAIHERKNEGGAGKEPPSRKKARPAY
jgi:hypothetical protein